MGRRLRSELVCEGSVNHCTWRSHGSAHVFDSDDACAFFLGLVRDHKGKYAIEIYSYTLMGTHPHVVCRSRLGPDAFSSFWRDVNGKFARWYNNRTGGRGQVVRDRMRSPQIQDGRHQLTVMRYGDLNPVRAGLVRTPGKWRWSSYAHYAFGAADDLITDAPEYVALGNTPRERRRAYLHLFATPLADSLLTWRRDLVNAPFIGDPSWIEARREHGGPSPPS